MPNQPKTPTITVRIDTGTVEELEHAAGQLGRDRSAIIRELVAWWLRQPGARMPPRPVHQDAVFEKKP